MNSKHDIRMLTERFFNGETTVDEERLLFSLYQSDEVPEDLQAYREMMLDMAAINQPQAKIVPLWQRPVLRWLAAAVVALAVVWGGITLFTPELLRQQPANAEQGAARAERSWLAVG